MELGNKKCDLESRVFALLPHKSLAGDTIPASVKSPFLDHCGLKCLFCLEYHIGSSCWNNVLTLVVLDALSFEIAIKANKPKHCCSMVNSYSVCTNTWNPLSCFGSTVLGIVKYQVMAWQYTAQNYF